MRAHVSVSRENNSTTSKGKGGNMECRALHTRNSREQFSSGRFCRCSVKKKLFKRRIRSYLYLVAWGAISAHGSTQYRVQMRFPPRSNFVSSSYLFSLKRKKENCRVDRFSPFPSFSVRMIAQKSPPSASFPLK